MASTGQKIFIWIIAITMLVGTFGAYFLVIIGNDNDAKNLKEQREAYAEMLKTQKEAEERQKKPAEPLPGYKAKKFTAEDITKLTATTIKEGSGKAAKADSTIEVKYFGWLADGKIFDSSNRGGDIQSAELGLNQVIEGWTKGLEGAKEGEVRKLLIPAKQGYGDQASGEIPANSPLAFIVEVVRVVE